MRLCRCVPGKTSDPLNNAAILRFAMISHIPRKPLLCRSYFQYWSMSVLQDIVTSIQGVLTRFPIPMYIEVTRYSDILHRLRRWESPSTPISLDKRYCCFTFVPKKAPVNKTLKMMNNRYLNAYRSLPRFLALKNRTTKFKVRLELTL